MNGYSFPAASLLRLALQACSWACLTFYVWWSVAYNFPTWTKSRATANVWSKFKRENTVRYRMSSKGGTVLSGSDIMAVMMWWLPALLAALCAHLASALPAPAVTAGKADSEGGREPRGMWLQAKAATDKVKRILSWQLPPRRLLAYWCDGLNVAEALGVACWIIAHCCAFSDYITNYSKRFAAFDQLGLHYSTPKTTLWLERISLAFAWLSLTDISLLFLPISHNSFLSLMTGLPYSALIRYHRWLGHSTMWMIALHGIFFYFHWIADPEVNFWEAFSDWGSTDSINHLAGSLAFFFGCALWITSLNWVRRKYFEVFYKTHIVGFIGFVGFAMLHYGGMWVVFAAGLALYAADYVLRLTQSQWVTAATAAHVSPDSKVAVVELHTEKGFSHCPVQELFMLLPSISRWQWHPFTIMGRRAGGEGQEVVTVAMKAFGGWTQEAIRHLGSGQPVPVRVTGAMAGCEMHELADYDHVVIVAGGIAATPVISLLSEIVEAKASDAPSAAHIRKVDVIWVARSATEFTILPTPILTAASDDSSWLSISLFSTGSSSKATSDMTAAVMVKDADAATAVVKDADVVKDAISAQHSSGSGSGSSGDFKWAHQLGARMTIDNGAIRFPAASAYFWNVASVVPSKSAGALYMVAVITAAFVGAFCAVVVTRAMNIEWRSKHNTPDTQYKVGMTTLIALVVDTIGLPMSLVVLPASLIRYWRGGACAIKQEALDTTCRREGSTCATLKAGGAQLSVPEEGAALNVACGRPDLKTWFRDTVAGSKAARVGVFCAGPAAMMDAAAQIVWGMNDRPSHSGQPHMEFHKFAFEL